MKKWNASRRRLAMAAALTLLAAGTVAGGGLGSAGVAAAQEEGGSDSQVQGPKPACGELPGVDDKCEAWSATWDYPPGYNSSHGVRGQDTPIGGIALSPAGDRIYQAGMSSAQNCGSYPPGSSPDRDCGAAVIVARDADGTQLWEARHKGPNGDFTVAVDVEVSPDGKVVYVAATEDSYKNTMDRAPGRERSETVGVRAYDASTGQELWAARYRPPDNGDGAVARSMALSPDGGEIYVTGIVEGDSTVHADALTVGFDADDGSVLWVTTRLIEEPSTEWASNVEVSPDGARVYVSGTGSTKTALGFHYDYVTIAYNAVPPEEPADPQLGAELWVARFDKAGLGAYPTGGLAVSPDGALIFVTGLSVTGTTPSARGALYEHMVWQTIAYDATTGQQVWRREHGEEDSYHNAAHALTISPDGTRLYVAGIVDGPPPRRDYDAVTKSGPSSKIGVVAYDVATGTVLMDAEYAGAFQNVAYGVQVGPDGETVYIVGDDAEVMNNTYWTQSGATSPEGAIASIVTVAFDTSTGTQRWAAHFDPRSGMGDNFSNTGNGLSFNTVLTRANRYVELSEDGERLYVSGTQFYATLANYVSPVNAPGDQLTPNRGDMLLLAYDTQTPSDSLTDGLIPPGS